MFSKLIVEYFLCFNDFVCFRIILRHFRYCNDFLSSKLILKYFICFNDFVSSGIILRYYICLNDFMFSKLILGHFIRFNDLQSSAIILSHYLFQSFYICQNNFSCLKIIVVLMIFSCFNDFVSSRIIADIFLEILCLLE